jgi:hypothetical protein
MNKHILRFSAVYIALVNCAWGQSVEGQGVQGIQLKLDSNLTLQQAGRFNDVPTGAMNTQNSPLADTPPMNILRDAGAEMVKVIELAVERDGIPADGQSAVVLTIRLFDKNNKPVLLPTRVTLETSLGRFKRLDRLDNIDLDKLEPGNQLMVQNGVGQITLVAPHEPGDANIRATSGNTFVEGRLSFIPDLRPMIAVGLIEGIINFRNFDPSKLRTPRSRDNFDQELRNFQKQFNDGKGDAAVRTAFFLKGAVKGEYLLTMAYESDKEMRDRFFRDIHPDEFYPVYGDASIKGYDAQTTSRFYVRVDNKKSYFMFGDLLTASTNEGRKLGNYSRTLTGVKEHYENKHLSVNVFAAKDNLRQVIDEFPARGVSGWYNLSQQYQGLTNSEKVELVTRDRNQRAIVLNTVVLTRGTDYELAPFSGQILLNRPIPSFDVNLNPNFIRVAYEVEEGVDRFWVGGADAQVKLGESIEVGGSIVEDRNPTLPYKLKSANSTGKLGEKTFVSAELAQSNGQSGSGVNVVDPVAAADKSGKAARLELRHNGEDLQARIYVSKSGSGFDNPSSGILPARTEAGGYATYNLNDKTRLIANATRSEDRLTSGKLDSVQASIERTITDNLKFELGLHRAKSNGIDQTPTLPATATSPTTPTGVGLNGGSNILPRSATEVLTDNTELKSVRAKLTAQSTGGKASAYIEGEQDTSEHEKRMLALGGDYRFSDRGRFYGRVEDIKNEADSQRAAVVGIDTSYMKDGQFFNEYRLRDALDKRSSESAIGVRNLWNIAEGLRFSTGFEYLRAHEGDGISATAATFGVDYTANPLWKGSGRLEARRDNNPIDQTTNWLSTFGLARKLDRDWTFLGKNIYSFTDHAATVDQVNERFQMGFAYRDTDTNRINWLSRYQYSYSKNDPALGARADDAGVIYNDKPLSISHELSTHVDYHPSKPHTINGGYAVRWVRDTLELPKDHTRQKSNYLQHWLHGRYIYDVTERVDLGLLGSVKYSPYSDGISTRAREYSLGAEIGYLMHQNLWASLGYNFIGFKDPDGLSEDNYTTKGPFLRLRYKFDHHTFSGKDSSVNTTLIPDSTKLDEKK